MSVDHGRLPETSREPLHVGGSRSDGGDDGRRGGRGLGRQQVITSSQSADSLNRRRRSLVAALQDTAKMVPQLGRQLTQAAERSQGDGASAGLGAAVAPTLRTHNRRTELIMKASIEVVTSANAFHDPAVTRLTSGRRRTWHQAQVEARAQAQAAARERQPQKVDEEQRRAAGQLRVLTLNVWVNMALVNAEAQVQNCRELNPDVICLQEAFHMRVLDAYRQGFPEYTCLAFGRKPSALACVACLLLHLSVAQVLYLIAYLVLLVCGEPPVFLGRWFFVLCFLCLAQAAFHLRNHYFIAFLMGNLTGMVMLVRRDTVELDDVSDSERSCVIFSDEGLEQDFLNAFRPRGYIMAAGKLRGRNMPPLPVRFATTHLNQPPFQPPGQGRHKQIKELMAACLHDDELFILAGDLNATPPGTENGTTCNTYKDLCACLHDAWADRHLYDPNADGVTWDQRDNPMCQTALNSLFYGTLPLRWRCDYVLWRYGSGCAVEQAEQAEQAEQLEQAEKAKQTGQAAGGSPKQPTASLRSCELVFTGVKAVSDHFGVLTVYDVFHA